jgi:hypothetical protein
MDHARPGCFFTRNGICGAGIQFKIGLHWRSDESGISVAQRMMQSGSKLDFIFSKMEGVGMAILLDKPIVNPTVLLTPPQRSASPEPEHEAAPSTDINEPQGSRFDGLLIFMCVVCWLLLWAMHVYEILAWAVA